MCGIAGHFGQIPPTREEIINTINAMKNRGPDYQDFCSMQNETSSVTLIHSRLSIIDLDPRANQPFERDGCIVVFNGEIYNYIELREELKKEGIVFKTDSDTEVLIEYYLKYGERCVDYFEGMWSFALYDKRKQTLMLSRDRFGEKPLYYLKNSKGFYFASEVKAIQKLFGKKLTINEKHLYRYIVNGHKSLYKTDETFFDEIKEVPFATNIILTNDDQQEYTYWTPEYTPKNISEKEAIDGIRHYLSESVKLRLRSDVPLAFCLSGGVDSASLVSIATKILGYDVTAFSIIDSDERYDEYDNIEATVLDTQCKNYKIKLDPKANNIERLESLIEYHDAPVATISYFVHSMLSETIAKEGFKISISGTAADEIFTGYYDHFNLHLYEVKGHPDYEKFLSDWKKYPAKFVRHPYFKKPDLYFNDPNIRDHIYLNNNEFSSYLKTDFKESFTETRYSDSLLRNRMLNELFHEVVRVILHEDDLNSMKYSLENRSPFLDRNLFEFVYSIPSEYLVKEGYAKYLLRASMEGVLNDKVRLAREKKGFNASINSIIDFNDKKHIEYILDESRIFEFIDKGKIENLLRQKQYSNSFKKFLFNFICTKIFLEQQ